MKVRIDKLTKYFGTRIALNQVSLEISGGACGIIGPGGAGKTTLLRILASLLAPSSGTASIDGIDTGEGRKIRGRIGYLPQEFSFYPSLTVLDAMDYLAVLSGVRPYGARKRLILDLLERVGLEDCLKMNGRVLPEGMKRRLGIAQAMLGKPGLLLADEPMAGLEPEESALVEKLLADLARSSTLIICSRTAAGMENICENLAVLKDGTLLYSGTADELIREADKRTGAGGIPISAVPSAYGLEDACRILLEHANATHPGF